MKLSPVERRDREMSGADLQDQITDLATMYGFLWLHVRPAQTAHGWRTPVAGPLGKGWPDLLFAHPKRRRLLAIEVKRERNDPVTADQAWVHSQLVLAGMEVHVVKPSDMTSGTVVEILSGIEREDRSHA